MNNENLCLIYSRRQWENGFDEVMHITKEDLDTAEKDEKGFIGNRGGIDCYLSRFLPAETKK